MLVFVGFVLFLFVYCYLQCCFMRVILFSAGVHVMQKFYTDKIEKAKESLD